MTTATNATAPDNTPTDLPAGDQAATDAGATLTDDGQPAGEDGGEPTPAVDREQVDLAAFDKGLSTLVGDGTPKTAADVVAEAAPPAPAPEPDAETDRAVKELGLKGRAEERFRELTSQVKELTPLREALAKHQITDASRIEQVIESAQRAQEWEDTVLASTATPEQFGSALNVIKAMNSDDPKMQNAAFDAMLGEVVNLGRRLGREVPGLVDPLEAHADLLQEVNNGDISRKRALEIAAQRATSTVVETRETTRAQQDQHQAALNQAITDITALNDQLKAADPDYARKLALLQPTLDVIRETVHPSQWKDKIERAYRKLPALPPAAAPAPAPAPAPRVPVSHMPVRPTGGNLSMRQKPKNDMEAFEAGLKSLQRD